MKKLITILSFLFLFRSGHFLATINTRFSTYFLYVSENGSLGTNGTHIIHASAGISESAPRRHSRKNGISILFYRTGQDVVNKNGRGFGL